MKTSERDRARATERKREAGSRGRIPGLHLCMLELACDGHVSCVDCGR